MLKWFADRLAQTGRKARDDERGFTLIELLVVVIIIGILAAIAIPTFLSQRDNAEAASVETDARNAATEIQSWGTENDGDYTGLSADALADDGYNIQFSDNNGFSAGPTSVDGGDGFSFSVDNGSGEFEVDYNSTTGGI